VTTPILFETLAKIGSELLVQTLKKPLKPKEQNEENVTICKKLSRKNGEVTPKNMTAEEIDRKVRALVPWPGVQCEIEGHPVKLLQTSLTPSSEDFALTCAKGSILFIKLLQTPGGKPMSGNAWERGHSK
jgi:methionyl-tRNA formyltransferase